MVQDTPVTDRDFAALFREEAGSILTEQQINDEIEREQTRSAQAARAGIAPNRFRGFNLQRYCKDIVRSHQPLSCLYLLLSDLTGAVSVLLPICCLLWVVRRLIAFPLAGAYCVCAIVCVCFYGISSICRRRLRTLLSGSVSDTTTLRQKAGRLQLISTVTAAILSFLLFFVYQSYFQQITKFASLQNIFLWFVSMMFLSGVHNVLRKPLHLIFCGRLVYRCPSKKPNCICNSTLYGKQGQYTASPPFSNDPHLSADRTVYYMYFGFSVHPTMSDTF